MTDKTPDTAKPPVTPEASAKDAQVIIDLTDSIMIKTLNGVGINGKHINTDTYVMVPRAIGESLIRSGNAEYTDV